MKYILLVTDTYRYDQNMRCGYNNDVTKRHRKEKCFKWHLNTLRVNCKEYKIVT